MTPSQKLCVIINTILIIQCVVTATVIYVKAKKTGELYSLMICNILMVLWLFFVMVEKMSSNLEQEYVAMALVGVPLMFIGAFWFIFSLYYAGIIKPENRFKIITLILLPPLLCYWPILTEKYRYLIIVSKTFGENKDIWGVLFYVNIAFIYGYTIASIVLLNKKLKERFGRNGKRYWLLIAILIPIAISILNQFNAVAFLGFDVLPMSFSFFCVILSIYIFRYGFIEIVPIASYELFSTMNEAVFIVDGKGFIAECNKAAEEYFGGLFGKCADIQVLLKRLNEFTDDKRIIEQLIRAADSEELEPYEDTLKINDPVCGIKQYSFSIVPLSDPKYKVIGKLLTFKDVTEYRLLTLENERNRLSDDLHDSLGNCINVISSNLEYVLKNFKDTQEIKDCLKTSYQKSTSAFLNLRRIVDELRPVDIENNGLIWALESLFHRLRIKDINIEFSYKNLDDRLLSGKKHGETIYFICQEAISNAVTHGRARSITVTLIYIGDQLKLYISDDGIGCGQIIKNKGLNSMENRIKSLGGEFNFGSPDDGGFNIRAVFPL